MDPLAFDRRVRFLAHASSRRRLFAALATLSGGAVAGRASGQVAIAPTLAAAAPNPAKHRASSAKRRCRTNGGRYFGPGACPCATLCLVGVTYSHFPCAIEPGCVCFPSATGGAICANGAFSDNPVGCATNADCIQMFGNDFPLCVLAPCNHPDGAPCGPGQPPCTAGQACLNGRCRSTDCLTACG